MTKTARRHVGQDIEVAQDQLVGMNVAVGRIAPDFETQDVDGAPFKLSDYRGKVVVIDFWGFW